MIGRTLRAVTAQIEDLQQWRRRNADCYALEALVKSSQPQTAHGTVIFAGLSNTRFASGNKISVFNYLPAFCELLRCTQYRTEFATSIQGLSGAIQNADYAIVVMIYGEDQFIPDHPALNGILARAHLVFNHCEIGKIIRNKQATHDHLSLRGVLMPKAQSGLYSTEKTFSNHNSSTGADVFLVAAQLPLDADRYNTDFIDTQITIDGEPYFSSIRLMCVGGAVTHSFVRVRKVAEGNPSVHAKNTPVDAKLLNTLYDRLVEPRKKELIAIAEKISLALGLGFYSHDLLIESATNQIYLAEVGFKFDDRTFNTRMSSILHDVPSMMGFTKAEDIAKNSFPAFLQILKTHQNLQHSVKARGQTSV